MKLFAALLTLLFTPAVFAQVIVDSPEYSQLKASGQLGNTTVLQNPGVSGATQQAVIDYTPPLKSGMCDCYVEPDSTYSLALAPTDDGSSNIISIPFDFCMYGTPYNTIYINNNGNITFTNPLGSFSSTAFPSTDNVIVAPFWADVDTRNGLGQVLYKITPTAVYINWVDVGYYAIHGDMLNTFQLTITDGTDPSIESGNVAFCYKDMQWTTGDASSGIGGFGGVPATAGANKGDGISYFLISRFDHPGNDFDGALGNPDGISWLDNKSFAFDVCNVGNVPPIPDGVSSCDTFKVCAYGDTADISIDFLSPETNQTTMITYDDGGLTTMQEIANIAGNTAHIVLRVIGEQSMSGFYTINVTATDDAIPMNGVTTLSFVIQIDSMTNSLNPVLTPLEGCDSVILSVLNGPYDTYLWDDLTEGVTDVLGEAGDYGVTVSIDGCYKRVHQYIHIVEPFVFDMGPFTMCPPATTAEVTIYDSLYYDSVSWGLANPALDSLYSNVLSAGTYTVHLVDSFGICARDTTFSITTQQPLILQPDDATCDSIYIFTANTGGSGFGLWTVLGNPPSPPVFENAGALNTTVHFSVNGTYQLMYSDENCGAVDTVEIVYEGSPFFGLDADFFVCPGDLEHLVVADSVHMSAIHWGITPPSADTIYTANLGPGTYSAHLYSQHGCPADTTFTIVTQPSVQLYQYTHVCGDSLEMLQNLGMPVGQWTYYNSPGTVAFRNPTALNTGLDVSEYGFYNLVFTEANCGNADTLSVEFIPYIGVDLLDSMEICMGQIVEVPSNIYYPDFTDDVLWNTGATTPTIMTGTEGYYTIVISNICNSHEDSTYVAVQICDIDLPNVFTPGGSDPTNGVWKILNPQDVFTEFSCIITNRWGNVLYEFEDQYDVWDGKDRHGSEAAAGVYFYIIHAKTLDGNDLDKQGFIHLER